MSHAGAADSLDQSFLDDAVLHVQGQLAGALLGSAPADAVRETGNVLDFLCLDPLGFLGDRGCAVLRTLGYRAHHFNFFCVNHVEQTPFEKCIYDAGLGRSILPSPAVTHSNVIII